MAWLNKRFRHLLFSGSSKSGTKSRNNCAASNHIAGYKISACPFCASQNVAIFIYGKPPLNKTTIEGLESGKFIPGGCMISKTAPKWHCNDCYQDFGQILNSI